MGGWRAVGQELQNYFMLVFQGTWRFVQGVGFYHFGIIGQIAQTKICKKKNNT